MSTPVVVFDADTVLTCTQRVLAAIVAAAAALPDATPLPDRQLVTSAGATWDCPMVYVSAMLAGTGLPEPGGQTLWSGGAQTWPQGNETAYKLTIEAAVVRQARTGTLNVQGTAARSPAVSLYTDDLTEVSSDTAVFVNAAYALVQAGAIPVPFSVNYLATQGTFHGVATTFEMEPFPMPGQA
jgi:hypothetical protein